MENDEYDYHREPESQSYVNYLGEMCEITFTSNESIPNSMQTNEIKKALYREKPQAELVRIDEDGMLYECTLEDKTSVEFLVDTEEASAQIFLPVMPAQLLIRWMVE